MLSPNATFTEAGLIYYKPSTYHVNTGFTLLFYSKNIKGVTIFWTSQIKIKFVFSLLSKNMPKIRGRELTVHKA
jgi:hypothetical protein